MNLFENPAPLNIREIHMYTHTYTHTKIRIHIYLLDSLAPLEFLVAFTGLFIVTRNRERQTSRYSYTHIHIYVYIYTPLR